MKVLVYVEGPSDKAGLAALLRLLIKEGRSRGVGISFHDLNGKSALLRRGPTHAAAYLKGNPENWVVALPDLYPMKKYTGTPKHSSFSELRTGLRKAFEMAANRRGVAQEARNHFLVHCLKHDLEALLLAAPDQLRERLRTPDRLGDWRNPVEDQDDDKPPKRVVEDLFSKYRRKPGYVDTTDAPRILEKADLAAVEAACPQCFAPFVNDLRAIVAGRSPPSWEMSSKQEASR